MLALLLALGAGAHELPESSATITLRDGHVDVRVEVVVAEWIDRAAPEGAPDDRLRVAASALVSDTWLVVDGERVPFASLRLPATDVLRADLSDHHAPHREVHLEASLPSRPASLALQLPDSLGAVHVTFVEPQTHFVPAGGRAAFRLPDSPATTARRP